MFFLLTISFLFAQHLNVNQSIYDKYLEEYNFIDKQIIKDNLFIYPVVNYEKNNSFNLLNKLNNIDIYPIFGLKYSQTGFEINDNVPIPIIWVTPGLEFNFNKLVINSTSPIWISGCLSFAKHSAYGVNENLYINSSLDFNNIDQPPLFINNPKYQFGYFRNVKNSNNGIDFDESNGYISIISNTFDLTIGKFRSSLGPSTFSNLSISNTIPPLNQIRFRYNYQNKVNFTFLIGDLYSNIIDTGFVYQEIGFSDKYSILPRRIFNHRIDFMFSDNFRIGLYEQVIGMAKNTLSYFNPLILYWSEQHQNSDLDNLQIGFDFDYMIEKNRIYGGLLIDEWALYDTFNDNSQNWFARQIGFSRIFSIRNNLRGLLKFEYSDAEPQVYLHKFNINSSYHHNYPLGLWSGGDSVDKRLSFILFFHKQNNELNYIIDLTIENTNIGTPNYDSNVSLLSEGIKKSRCVYSINLKKTFYDALDWHFKVGYFDTENLYSEDNFLEFSTSILYNIQK